MFTSSGSGQTDLGERVTNDDVLFCDDALGLYAVADGLGGHAGGAIAAAIAIESVVAKVATTEDAHEMSGLPLLRLAAACIEEASRAVQLAALQIGARSGCKCTLTLVLVTRRSAVVAHVGDSRAYLVRGSETKRLTEDHTLTGLLLEAGELTEAQAQQHPFRHVLTRYVGARLDPKPDVFEVDIAPGDHIVLCTDGVSEHLDIERLPDTLQRQSTGDAVQHLVSDAVDDGTADNATCIVVAIDEALERMSA